MATYDKICYCTQAEYDSGVYAGYSGLEIIIVDIAGTPTGKKIVNNPDSSCLGDIKYAMRSADHNGWYKMGETERVMSDYCWNRLVLANLGTRWTNAYGEKIIPAGSGRILGTVSALHLEGSKIGAESVSLTTDNLPTHKHQIKVGHGTDDNNFNCDYLVQAADNAPNGSFLENHNTENNGQGQSFSTMPPTLYAGNLFIFLGV